jgi:hypothetical protein
VYLHEELYELLQKAFDGSDIPWADCFHEDRGDGALIVVPPYITCCSACWSRGRSSARSRSGAELALMVSEDVYRSLACRCPSLVSPEVFQRVGFQVKQTRGRAWIYLPGTPAQL